MPSGARELDLDRHARLENPLPVVDRHLHAVHELRSLGRRLDVAGRELAGRRLDAEQKKFDLGTSTVRFVLEEQRNLAQAESDEIQALVNYTKSLVVYDKAIGNTLARNSIELDKQLPGPLASQK